MLLQSIFARELLIPQNCSFHGLEGAGGWLDRALTPVVHHVGWSGLGVAQGHAQEDCLSALKPVNP